MAVSAEKKREMKVYAQFYEFNESLLLNLKYGREKVSKIADGYDYVKKIMNGEEVVKGDGGEFLKSYVACIGTTDAPTQVDYLTERKQILQKMKQNSEERYKKYGSMYFKLSLMAGILIAVLLA